MRIAIVLSALFNNSTTETCRGLGGVPAKLILYQLIDSTTLESGAS
jgi:hypothetical protein